MIVIIARLGRRLTGCARLAVGLQRGLTICSMCVIFIVMCTFTVVTNISIIIVMFIIIISIIVIASSPSGEEGFGRAPARSHPEAPPYDYL